MRILINKQKINFSVYHYILDYQLIWSKVWISISYFYFQKLHEFPDNLHSTYN